MQWESCHFPLLPNGSKVHVWIESLEKNLTVLSKDTESVIQQPSVVSEFQFLPHKKGHSLNILGISSWHSTVTSSAFLNCANCSMECLCCLVYPQSFCCNAVSFSVWVHLNPCHYVSFHFSSVSLKNILKRGFFFYKWNWKTNGNPWKA